MTLSLSIAAPLLILAGGRATRLGRLSEELPKYLMPVGPGRTFADVQLEWARAQGFRRVILSVGYRGEQVRAYCGDGRRHGLEIHYSFDGPVPLGTAGAVRAAFPRDEPYAAVIYGDTMLELSCAEVVEVGVRRDDYALMTVYRNDVPGHACNATVVGDRVVYSKTSPGPDWTYIDYGFLLLSAAFARDIPARIPLDLAVPLESASAAGRLAGYVAANRFWEIGSPEAWTQFQQRFGGVPVVGEGRGGSE